MLLPTLALLSLAQPLKRRPKKSFLTHSHMSKQAPTPRPAKMPRQTVPRFLKADANHTDEQTIKGSYTALVGNSAAPTPHNANRQIQSLSNVALNWLSSASQVLLSKAHTQTPKMRANQCFSGGCRREHRLRRDVAHMADGTEKEWMPLGAKPKEVQWAAPGTTCDQS